MPDEAWESLDIDSYDVSEIQEAVHDHFNYVLYEIGLGEYFDWEEINWVYEIEETDKLSKKECSNIEDALEDYYGEKFKIENAYELDGMFKPEVDLDGIDDEDDREYFENKIENYGYLNSYAVLIDDEWYLMDSYDNYMFIFPNCYNYYPIRIEEEATEGEAEAPADDDWYYGEETAEGEAEAEDATEAEWVFQSAIDNYEELFNGNVTKSTLKAVMPNVAWNHIGLTSNDIRDIEDFAYSYCYEDIFDLYEDISQEDIVWMLDVESTDSLTYSEIWDIEEELEDYYGEYIAVDEAYELHCVLRFGVDLDCIYYYDEREEVEDDLYYFDSEDVYAYAIKIDGKWYLVDGYDRYMFRFPACGWFFDDYTKEDEEAAAEDDWYYGEDAVAE